MADLPTGGDRMRVIATIGPGLLLLASYVSGGCASTSPRRAVTSTGTPTVVVPTSTWTRTPSNTPSPTPTGGGHLYVVAGSAFSFVSTVYSAQIVPGGGLGSWTTTSTDYPMAANMIGVAASGGALFGFSGWTAVEQSAVYRAPAAAGVTGTWTTDTVLPVALAWPGVAVAGGSVYVVGGYSSGSVSTVYVNTLAAGVLGGSWTTTSALPAGVHGQGVVVSSGSYLYSIAGFTSNYASVVYSAQVLGGALAGWTSLTVLPSAAYAPGTATDGSYVYVVGGLTGPSSGSTTLYWASLTAGGGMGPWSSAPNPAGATAGSGVVVAGGYLYVVGGIVNGSTPISDVYSAPVGGGSVGSFTSLAPLPDARAYIKPVVAP